VTVALLAGETVLLVLLSILVVGLLRSHAEILRRLGPEREEATSSVAIPPPGSGPEREDAPPATDISGATLNGDAVQIGLGPGSAPTLLAFLSSGCSVCEGFWRDFQPDRRGALPGAARLAIVVKDSSHERPARLRELAPSDVPLVMSSAAWEAYGVPSTPYFVYVDGSSGRIYGEGAASGWEQVSSLLADALDDLAVFEGQPGGEAPARPARSGVERALRAERELQRAGIGPGHPSLYPASEREGQAG
jgi:hypothetical protein